MEGDHRDEWKPQFGAAIVTGASAAIATVVSAELAVRVTALVTLLASLAGWAAARVLTHRASRAKNALLAIALVGAALTTVRMGDSELCAPESVLCFVGGCEPFSVYAQNRYIPLGTLIRAEPRRTGREVGSFAPNKLVPLDGWVRTHAAYPHNSPPFDSDVWFHLADDRGWVSFAGVRADPTTPVSDPNDPDGGRPAPTDPRCSGTFR